MKKLFRKLPAATAAILVAASVAMVSVDAAGARGGGGGGGGGGRGGGGGGGGAHASGADRGGGGGRQNAQVDNSRADSRTNNTRSTSVNNVNNVNVERNVNVSGNNGCCNGGWDNDYHPVATAAAITATAAVIGSIVRAPPPGCVPVNYGGMVYQQCGSTWYAPQGSQFAVVAPPY